MPKYLNFQNKHGLTFMTQEWLDWFLSVCAFNRFSTKELVSENKLVARVSTNENVGTTEQFPYSLFHGCHDLIFSR